MISFCSIPPMNASYRDRMGDILICKLQEHAQEQAQAQAQAHVP